MTYFVGPGKYTSQLNNRSQWYTIILNHPRGWGGKPTGSHADSRVAEISHDIRTRLFCAQNSGKGFVETQDGQRLKRRQLTGQRTAPAPVKNQVVHDNTKPSARMGRKAYRVSQRQPGRRNITRYSDPAFFMPIPGQRQNRHHGNKTAMMFSGYETGRHQALRLRAQPEHKEKQCTKQMRTAFATSSAHYHPKKEFQ